MLKYSIKIFYSEEDEGYIAIVPKLPSCSAFGETPQEAVEQVQDAIDLHIEIRKQEKLNIPDPEHNPSIGELIKESRLYSGLTQSQLADKINTQSTMISRIEKHPENITLKTLNKIAQALGKKVEISLI